MRIVDESYLLFTNDAGRPEPSSAARSLALRAAVLVDLLLTERIAVTVEQQPRVRVISAEPVGDAVLDAGIRVLARSPESVREILCLGAIDPTETVVGRLIAGGVLGPRSRTWFGLGAYRAASTVDPAPAWCVRTRLAGVLDRRAQATYADVALLSLLLGVCPALRGVRGPNGLLPPSSGYVTHEESMDVIAGLLAGWPAVAALVGVLQEIAASTSGGARRARRGRRRRVARRLG